MNGVHDMDGVHGFGPIRPAENEPIFHIPWDVRAFGMAMESQGTYAWEDLRIRLIQ
jgi:nitrile hydratase